MNALARRIRDVLALDPAAPAVEFEDRSTAWRDLSAVADATGAQLDAAGLGEGAAVGLLLRNHPGMVAALLGVVASGRCAVTLSPHLGAAGLAADLAALRLPAVVGVAAEWQRAELRDGAAAVESLGLAIEGHPVPRAVARVQDPGAARDLHAPRPGVALEMMTSGTTGPPRRIPLRADALIAALLGAKHYESGRDEALRLRRGVAVLSAPLVHVAGIFRVLQCVCDGRRFALMERFAVGPWLALVRRHRPKTVSLVPAALGMVLEAGVSREDLASVRAVFSGTAPLAPETAEAFEAATGIPVLTSYGATEFAGGVAGWNLADHRRFAAAKRGSVGRAHPGCALRVVSPEDARVLAPGEEGLLEVRAAQLGGGGWLRTTDRAVLDADGFLWIRGRADAAILRGGFKVQPEQVAGALERHPSVREAAVVGLPDARLGAVPAAAVELRPGAEPVDGEALRAFAREQLAGYQVPERILVVARLPRTASLKVSLADVRALFDPR